MRRMRLTRLLTVLVPGVLLLALLALDVLLYARANRAILGDIGSTRGRVEAVTLLRRDARRAQVLLLEWMLTRDDASRAEKAKRVEDGLAMVANRADDLDRGYGLKPAAREALDAWTGRVRLALKEGPPPGAGVEELKTLFERVDAVVSEAWNQSSDTGAAVIARTAKVMYQRLWWHAGIVLMIGAMAVLLALGWRKAKEAEARLADSERGRVSMRRMSSSLAHEINNQLAVIENTIALLRRRGVDESLVKFQEEAAGEIRTLSADLVAFGDAGQGTRQPVDLVELVREVADSFGSVVSVSAGPPVWVMVERSGLFQAVARILKNAVEAGGPVELTVDRFQEHARLQCCDRGKGISAENAARAGEPFFTTKAKGAGLGLAIAAEFGRRNGGRLRLSNREGGGVIAELSLPAHQGPESCAAYGKLSG